jgi:hypothetical protein
MSVREVADDEAWGKSPSGLARCPCSYYYSLMKDTPDVQVDVEAAEIEALRRAIAVADEAAKAGRVVSHDRVRPWLLDLAQGKRTPRPTPE